MDRDQELEWLAAQKINISEDLVAAAKQQLVFLSAVDRRRFLYAGPVVDRAIHRYKTCWLPLLAKFTESGSTGSPLVVPLDCEWIWHCHRLNPVQYKKDCEKLFGRILDNKNVKSSLQVQGEYSKDQTVQLWTELFPEEPFEFDLTTAPAEAEFTDHHEDSQDGLKGSITYDLVAAVGRQSTFYYHICSSTMRDDRYLEEALARYKAFLYLIKRNKQKASVPTFDIDLMWHSHQLQPVSYCKDMLELLGKLLEHDEIVTGASREIKLENGFSETTKQWENLYGLRYWREGAIFKGSDSSPPLVSPYRLNLEIGHRPKVRRNSKILNLVQMQLVEVLLEIVGIRNLPTRKKSNLFVSFSKQQYDFFLSGHPTLNIFSETGEKHVAAFHCEAQGDLVLTLVSNSSRKSARAAEVIGTTSISIDELVSSKSKLFLQEWFELSKCQSHSGDKNTKPVSILVAASVSVPAPSPFIFYMVKGRSLSESACFLSHPGTIQNDYCTHFIHANGNEVISLKIRNSSEEMSKDDLTNKRQVIATTKFNRKRRVLAEYEGNAWSLRDPNFAFRLERKIGLAGDVLEIKGDAQIRLYLGRRLGYEPESNNVRIDKDLVTIVEFSADYPYGRALAMFGLESGILRVNESWFVLPAVLMSFIISDYFESEGYGASHLTEGAAMASLADETTGTKGALPKWRTCLSGKGKEKDT